jgi:hypothetical protein
MALKYWKKSKNKLSWSNSKAHSPINKITIDNFGPIWRVHFRRLSDNFILSYKYFKNKSQAIKFVKLYIKK